VGELSALNAVAGAYSEYVPIVHVVGCPSTISQRDGKLLHHTLGNGDFNVFKNMATQVAVGVADLSDPSTAAELIDEVLERAWTLSRPVYVWLPSDMVHEKVEGARLDEVKLKIESFEPNDKEKEEYVTDVVLKHLQEAQRPIVLVDACTIRHRSVTELKEFLDASKLPFCTSPMGKAVLDEGLPSYCGTYAGSATSADLKSRVEDADLVLAVGSIKSDFNTAGFSYAISKLNTIDFHSYGITVSYSEYPKVRMNGLFTNLTKRIKEQNISLNIVPGPKYTVANYWAEAADADSKKWGAETITHAFLWPKFSDYLRPGDVVVTETGTSNFGIMQTAFPKNATSVNQYLWGSIGYATGAAQGAAMAVADLKAQGGEASKKFGRSILWTGDGSFQLTAQAVATMLRNNVDLILFLINNDG
jgi:pyruvate decarboxylase